MNGTNGDTAELSRELIDELSWADFVRLTCMFERWANRDRHDPHYRIRWLEQADAMRAYVAALPHDWEPPRRPGKPSILKFLADLENPDVPKPERGPPSHEADLGVKTE